MQWLRRNRSDSAQIYHRIMKRRFYMAGKDNGVQALIRNTYPKAVFVHCSSHRLNVLGHDLNYVADVRNTIGTVKSIIKFSRDSPKRRRLVPNIPLLCETRWSAKYKSIRIFSENCCDIYAQLEQLEANQHEAQSTRQTAHHAAEVCCRNHNVPHLSEDHCEVLSDVGASDPTATGSRHGDDGSPRSHRPVDEGFPSLPGWCRSCVLRPNVGGSIEEY